MTFMPRAVVLIVVGALTDLKAVDSMPGVYGRVRSLDGACGRSSVTSSEGVAVVGRRCRVGVWRLLWYPRGYLQRKYPPGVWQSTPGQSEARSVRPGQLHESTGWGCCSLSSRAECPDPAPALAQPCETVVQKMTPPHLLGRVFGTLTGLAYLGIPVGFVVASSATATRLPGRLTQRCQ